MIIGITFSCFDLLHPGHLMFLEECSTRCDYLIVGLQSEPTHKSKPVETLYERYKRLSSCRWVDSIIPYSDESDIELILMTLKPNLRFLGSDYKNKVITGSEYCKNNNIEIVYIDREHNLSSTNLKIRILNS